MRLSRDEIYKKMTENGCHHTMSWSKFNTFIEDPYSFYLKYVHDPRIPEERQNSYAFLGDIVHNGLESLYDGSKTMDQIIRNFCWLEIWRLFYAGVYRPYVSFFRICLSN